MDCMRFTVKQGWSEAVLATAVNSGVATLDVERSCLCLVCAVVVSITMAGKFTGAVSGVGLDDEVKAGFGRALMKRGETSDVAVCFVVWMTDGAKVNSLQKAFHAKLADRGMNSRLAACTFLVHWPSQLVAHQYRFLRGICWHSPRQDEACRCQQNRSCVHTRLQVDFERVAACREADAQDRSAPEPHRSSRQKLLEMYKVAVPFTLSLACLHWQHLCSSVDQPTTWMCWEAKRAAKTKPKPPTLARASEEA